MTTILVVVVDPVIDLIHDFLKGTADVDDIFDFILYVTIKTLLRSVIPAVPAVGHRLHKVDIPELFNEGVACVVTALIRMNYDSIILNTAVFYDKCINRIKYKVNLEAYACLIG